MFVDFCKFKGTVLLQLSQSFAGGQILRGGVGAVLFLGN